MAGQLRSATYLLIAACWLGACSANMGDPAVTPFGPAPTAAGAATPGATAPAATTPGTPAAAQPIPGVQTQATPTMTAAGMAAMAAMAAMPGVAATPDATTPGAPAVAAPPLKVTERGSCAAPDRRVSYHTPCGDDPDPCKLKTGFDGDEYCWPAPKEGEGVQLHIGPENWSDPAEVQKYVVEPGSETLDWWGGTNPLTENKWFDHVQYRMRPGSHHWMISIVNGKIKGGRFGQTMSCGSTSVASLGGGQSLILDSPPQGIAAPEDDGYGAEIPGNSSLCANIHHYNLTDHPQIREVWMNVYFTDEAKVTKRGERITMIGAQGLSIPPGAAQTLTYRATFGAEGRIRQLFGHRHKWTDRFAVWVNNDLIYDSWSWMESVTYIYDSITQNPPIMTDAKVDGAVSGIVPIKAGDVLKYSCFVKNGSDTTLTFRNDIDSGEMCNLFGGTVGTGTGVMASGF